MFFLISLRKMRKKLLTPDWPSGENTRSFGFIGVQPFKPGCLSQKYMEIKCCVIKEIPEGEFSCLTRNSKTNF